MEWTPSGAGSAGPGLAHCKKEFTKGLNRYILSNGSENAKASEICFGMDRCSIHQV